MEPLNEYLAWNLRHMRPAQDAMLTDGELDELFDLMNSDDLPESAMTAEQADGYMTGCVLAPEPVMLDWWMETVFDQPTLPLPHDEARQNRLLHLLRQRYLDIQLRLDMPQKQINQSTLFTPLRTEVPAGDCITPYRLDHNGQRIGLWDLKEWAQGFRQAMDEDERWGDLIADPQAFSLVAPVLLLSVGYNPDKPDFQIDDDDTLPVALIQSLYGMRHWWRDYRRKAAQAQHDAATYQREAPKVGRNDPCPCGSGKKFKKCCGA